MKRTIFIITAIFMMAFASCDSKKEIKSIKSNEFRTEIMTPDIQLVDVRVPEAFNEGHIPGAKNLDFTSEHFDDMMKQLDKKNPVAVYCRGGRQSMEAAEKLQDAGFEVIHLDGGILTWDGEVETIGN
ncbi:MAG: rhodanese-like domain-containing protein [Bacteroidales bacterium]|nr:rhodanese-like domain-containing protein [Bacteroidales bacterium]MBR7175820.1 rhodanese-like domain-containing protein [Bacteroidales bacterium]